MRDVNVSDENKSSIRYDLFNSCALSLDLPYYCSFKSNVAAEIWNPLLPRRIGTNHLAS